jgi:hypothetical protein
MRVCAVFTAFYLLGVLIAGVTTIVVVDWLDGRVDLGFGF